MPPAIRKLIKPFLNFIHAESTAGILLIVSAMAAVFLANSSYSEWYHHLWENHLAISLGSLEIDKSVHHWINDGLMAMFFFVVGLELKREIMAGELSNFRKAIVPIAAAIGGMVVPALLFILFNPSGEELDGWGISMATDIAFALGILALLGKRVPISLKIFLTALAIADDLGAVLVIAFFYTSEIYLLNLGFGLLLMLILLAGNYAGIRSTLFYGLIGIGGVWLAFLTSGVHATIAGVLAAMAIPARTKINEKSFLQELEIYVSSFKAIPPNDVTLLEPAQHDQIEKINLLTLKAVTPLQRMERSLHPWVSFVIMPLFAFANAGVDLTGDAGVNMLFEPVTLGVFTGLVVGKFSGVFLMTWLLVRFRLATLPEGLTWSHIAGAGLLAGIGFTMSLFVTSLAYEDAVLIQEAKIGIFAASLFSGVLGYFFLKRVLSRQKAE